MDLRSVLVTRFQAAQRTASNDRASALRALQAGQTATVTATELPGGLHELAGATDPTSFTADDSWSIDPWPCGPGCPIISVATMDRTNVRSGGRTRRGPADPVKFQEPAVETYGVTREYPDELVRCDSLGGRGSPWESGAWDPARRRNGVGSSSITFVWGGEYGTGAMAVTRDASQGPAVIEPADPAVFLSRYINAPAVIEAPLDYSLASAKPRRHDHAEEPEAPSVWEHLQRNSR